MTQKCLSKNHFKSQFHIIDKQWEKDEILDKSKLFFSSRPHWIFQKKGKEADHTLFSSRKSR